jgi:hypothetical protein
MSSILYLQQFIRIVPGKGEQFVETIGKRGVPLLERSGLKLVGAWEVQLSIREFYFLWRVERAEAFADQGWLLRAPNIQPRGAALRTELEPMTESIQGTLMQAVPMVRGPEPGPAKGYKRRRLYYHEVAQVKPGQMINYLGQLAVEGLPAWNASGWRIEGLFRTHTRPRELNWLVSYEEGRQGLFEPKNWLDERRPLPEIGGWMEKGWQWRDEWQDRFMLPLPFSPMQ